MRRTRNLTLALLVPTTLASAACGSSPTPRFYALTPVQQTSATNNSVTGLVIIDHVAIPDYLARRGLVRKSGPNVLTVAEFDRWAEPLDRNITNVLVDQLQARFPAATIAETRSRFLSQPDQTIRVNVSAFEADTEGRTRLSVTWEITHASAGQDQAAIVPSLYARTFESSLASADIPQSVASMNTLVGELGQAIGDSLVAAN